MPAFVWKDQTDSSYQMQGEPRLCQLDLFSAVAFRAICQQGLYGLHWYRYRLLIDTCTCPVSRNLMRQMHSSHTRPWRTSCLRGYGHL